MIKDKTLRLALVGLSVAGVLAVGGWVAYSWVFPRVSFAAGNRKIAKDAMAQICPVIEHGFAEARSGTHESARYFESYPHLCGLACAYLCDCVTKKGRSEKIAQEAFGRTVFEPLNESVSSAVSVYVSALAALDERGKQQYGPQFALPSECDVVNVIQYDEDGKSQDGGDVARDLAVDAGISTAIGVVACQIAKKGVYKSTGKLYKTVLCKLIGKASARFAATSTTALLTSQADSPLPGPADIVAVGIEIGGVVWLVHDLWKIKKDVPAELAEAMDAWLVDYERVLKERLAQGMNIAVAALERGVDNDYSRM